MFVGQHEWICQYIFKMIQGRSATTILDLEDSQPNTVDFYKLRNAVILHEGGQIWVFNHLLVY